MKFSCTKNVLAGALQTVTKALASRTTNVVLEGILIETEEDGLIRMTCSDERITIVTRFQASISEHGRGIVPGKLFNEIVRRFPEGITEISTDYNFVFTLKSGSARANVSGMDADLFPHIPEMNNQTEISLPQNMLKDMIEKTEFAIAVEDSREVLTGCLLEISSGTVSMVALDGFRLALRKALCSDVLENVSAIIPGRAISDIGKLLSGDENAFCTLAFSDKRMHITMDQTEVYVILVEGQYIQYKKILPTAFGTRVKVQLDSFRSCIDRAALIAREGSNNLIMFSFEDGTVTVESHSQIGDVHEELPVEQDGNNVSIAFNVKYITDMVRYIDSETIEFCMNNSINPCIVNPVNDDNYMHLILPVRTGAR